jgi:hypothetical protein
VKEKAKEEEEEMEVDENGKQMNLHEMMLNQPPKNTSC